MGTITTVGHLIMNPATKTSVYAPAEGKVSERNPPRLKRMYNQHLAMTVFYPRLKQLQEQYINATDTRGLEYALREFNMTDADLEYLRESRQIRPSVDYYCPTGHTVDERAERGRWVRENSTLFIHGKLAVEVILSREVAQHLEVGTHARVIPYGWPSPVGPEARALSAHVADVRTSFASCYVVHLLFDGDCPGYQYMQKFSVGLYIDALTDGEVSGFYPDDVAVMTQRPPSRGVAGGFQCLHSKKRQITAAAARDKRELLKSISNQFAPESPRFCGDKVLWDPVRRRFVRQTMKAPFKP